MNLPQKRLRYPIEEGLDLIGVSRSQGYKLIAAGELPTTKEGKRRYVTHAALEAYVEKKQRESDGQGRAAA